MDGKPSKARATVYYLQGYRSLSLASSQRGCHPKILIVSCPFTSTTTSGPPTPAITTASYRLHSTDHTPRTRPAHPAKTMAPVSHCLFPSHSPSSAFHRRQQLLHSSAVAHLSRHFGRNNIISPYRFAPSWILLGCVSRLSFGHTTTALDCPTRRIRSRVFC